MQSYVRTLTFKYFYSKELSRTFSCYYNIRTVIMTGVVTDDSLALLTLPVQLLRLGRRQPLQSRQRGRTVEGETCLLYTSDAADE